MDDKGRLIIPGELRKDGKPFIGATFEETKAMEEATYNEGNRHERRAEAAVKRKIAELEAQIKLAKS